MKFYNSNGSLEVICGSMFSGKTEELIKKLKRYLYANKKIQTFKHSFDNRFGNIDFLKTHHGEKLEAITVSNCVELLDFISFESEIIGIDEVQFFEKDIIFTIDSLIRRGKKVIVSGLDLDFRGLPFGPMPFLLALADEVIKLKAVCFKNGTDARFSQRIINGKPANANEPTVLVGGMLNYEARSRKEFEIDDVPLKDYIEKYYRL